MTAPTGPGLPGTRSTRVPAAHGQRHYCPNCGLARMLDDSKRHYCDCCTKAPYRMLPESVVNAVDEVVSKFKRQLGRLKP